jgi:hypothetical protein
MIDRAAAEIKCVSTCKVEKWYVARCGQIFFSDAYFYLFISYL